MVAVDPRILMWTAACEMIDRAERLHRQFFQPIAAPIPELSLGTADRYHRDRFRNSDHRRPSWGRPGRHESHGRCRRGFGRWFPSPECNPARQPRSSSRNSLWQIRTPDTRSGGAAPTRPIRTCQWLPDAKILQIAFDGRADRCPTQMLAKIPAARRIGVIR